MGTSGTYRGCSWSFVPFLSKITCLGSCRILGLASRIGTNGIFCTCHGKLVSTSIFGGVDLHQTICYLFPFGRVVRSSHTRKRGATLLLPLPRYQGILFFSGYTESIRFPQPINTTSCGKKYSIRLVPMLSGGLRHTLTFAICV